MNLPRLNCNTGDAIWKCVNVWMSDHVLWARIWWEAQCCLSPLTAYWHSMMTLLSGGSQSLSFIRFWASVLLKLLLAGNCSTQCSCSFSLQMCLADMPISGQWSACWSVEQEVLLGLLIDTLELRGISLSQIVGTWSFWIGLLVASQCQEALFHPSSPDILI